MRLIIATAILAATTGCLSSPVAPSEYTCLTQSRSYYNPTTGISTQEIDHYTQSTPYPSIPIK